MAGQSSAALAEQWDRERRERRHRTAVAGLIATLFVGGLVGITRVEPQETVTVVATLAELPHLATFDEARPLGGYRSTEVTRSRGFGGGARSTVVVELAFEPYGFHVQVENPDAGGIVYESYADPSHQWQLVPVANRTKTDGRAWVKAPTPTAASVPTTAPVEPMDLWALTPTVRGPVLDLGPAPDGLRRYRFDAEREGRRGDAVVDIWVAEGGIVHRIESELRGATSVTTYTYGRPDIRYPAAEDTHVVDDRTDLGPILDRS